MSESNYPNGLLMTRTLVSFEITMSYFGHDELIIIFLLRGQFGVARGAINPYPVIFTHEWTLQANM